MKIVTNLRRGEVIEATAVRIHKVLGHSVSQFVFEAFDGTTWRAFKKCDQESAVSDRLPKWTQIPADGWHTLYSDSNICVSASAEFPVNSL